MNKIIITLLSAILAISPFVIDRGFYVTNARRGIDLTFGQSTNITTNITNNGTVTGGGDIPQNMIPAYIQVNGQVLVLKQITRSLYQNFGK